MIDWILNADTELFLFLNSFHHKSLDPFMIAISEPLYWLPIILILFIYLFKIYKKSAISIIIALLTVAAITDFTSGKIVKPTVKRLRPCKVKVLRKKTHTTKETKCGGKYGFFSSHASNMFGLAVFLLLIFWKSKKSIRYYFIPLATLVAYSRIYLGKHYPSDILVGAIFGSLVGYFIHKLFIKITSNYNKAIDV